MGYSERLRLEVQHAFFDEAVPPLEMRPSDPRGFDAARLLLRQRGRFVHVLQDDAVEDQPSEIALTLLATAHDLFAVTKGAVWGAVVHLTAGLDQEALAFDEAGPAQPTDTAGRFLPVLATLDIALPSEGRRDLLLRCDAVAAHWAYHLIGAGQIDALEVVDSAGAVAFEDLGEQDLPNGQAARVIRSIQALAARARPPERFALQKAGPFGPETLVPVLPAAAIDFKPIPDTGAPPRLQSDIFVTLW
ncbi:hypothetical protein So717_24350 [Roseobacter cerasinus]|uniref:Uncharacterized protein n=1 Tax=Roseobacter cerasinus TaxID=2602289 RepID=A0A640VSM7_9RHOB|nr:hypothetical protein [Roseobacter cerasinus]GFE50682.1 hypothetical protein So717_24350 [Roseobacter cerasinus]